MPVLQFEPALKRPNLLGPTVTLALNSWAGPEPVGEILVAEIDPAYTASAEFCAHYGVATNAGSNCVIVAASRGDQRTLAACVAPISCKMDINGVVRRTLNARKVSFAPRDEVLNLTQMEYGGVTPIGLPSDWTILIDQRVADSDRIIVGAGTVRAKLSVPGRVLANLPGAQVVSGLGVEMDPQISQII